MSKLKIGILGSRGIPNAYGGFEQFAEYLSLGLTKKGHQVYVYNSHLHPYKEKIWRGVHIIHCRDWENRMGTAGQFLYDLNCINDARRRNFEVLLQLGYTSNSIWNWRWPTKAVNIINMDGLEWRREKYSGVTRKFLKMAEAWAVKHADHLIADSSAIRDYLEKTYNSKSTFIPYGACIFNDADPSLIAQFNLKPGEYYLSVSRMEPENNVEMIIRGYLDSKRDHPLLLAGNTNNKFGKQWEKKYSSEKIRFIGGVYDKVLLNHLRFFSKLYFHGHSAGGTNPSLLEAMACGCRIVAHENPFNRSVLQEDADFFSSNKAIADILNSELSDDSFIRRKQDNLQKIRSLYNWENIIDDYERLMIQLVDKRKGTLLAR